MLGRFVDWALPVIIGVLIGVLVTACVLRGGPRPTAYGLASPRETARGADFTLSSVEAAGGGAFTPAGGADPLPASSAVSPDPWTEAGATKADGAGFGFQPVPSADFPDSVTLDLADWASLPPLKPLASDCRLPCFGIERRGPASWYRDWHYGPNALYAAIPGYLGGVVSVVVCTFPEGRANCLTVPVVDVCGCLRHTPSERVVDLSPAAFVWFQPDLLRGLVMVQITVLR